MSAWACSGLAGAAQLALVGVDGGQSGTADQRHIALLVVLEEAADETLYRADQRGIGRGPRRETDHGVSLPVDYRFFCLRARAAMV